METNLENKRIEEINKIANKSDKTKDPKYNRGLRAIQKFGYEYVMENPDVEYWCRCNNL